MRGSVSFVTTLALLVPAGAVCGASGGELAQARPRPVQKGKGPIRPGETPPPTEAASAEAASTGADRTQSLAEVREKAQASLVEAAKAHEGRLVVFYSYESDIGDGWEPEGVHDNPPEKRLAALRMGTNLLVYAMTR